MRENNLSFSLKGPKTDTAKIYIYITKYIQEIKFQTLLPFRFSLTFYLIAPSVFSNVYLLTTIDIYKTSTISMWLYVIFTIPDIFFTFTTFNVIHSYCYILVILSAKVVVESKTLYNRNSFTVSNNKKFEGVIRSSISKDGQCNDHKRVQCKQVDKTLHIKLKNKQHEPK